jgi:hypothetical protein
VNAPPLNARSRFGPRWRGLILIAVVVAIAVAVVVSNHDDRPGFSASSVIALVPTDAQAVLETATLGRLGSDLTSLARQLEGSGAIMEAAGALLGLPRLDAAALTAAGIDAKGALVAFVADGAVFVGISGVHDAGVAHFVATLNREGVAVVATPGHVDRWTVGTIGASLRRVGRDVLLARLPLPADIRAALGATGLAAMPDDATSTVAIDAAWVRWREAPKGDRAESALQSQPGVAARLTLALGAGDTLRPRLRSSLGPAALLFGRVADQIEGISVELSDVASSPRLSVRFALPQGLAKELANYHQAFLSEARALDLGEQLPDEVALWARVRLNPALLEMVPGFLRERLLPANLLGRLDPALATVDARTLLLDTWDGQVAAGLLGVDDAYVVDAPGLQRGNAQALADLAEHAAVFLAIGLRDATARQRLQAAVVAAYEAAGRSTRPFEEGALKGVVVEGKRPITLIGTSAGLVVVVGDGEHERWVRVARGRLPTLGAAASTSLERELVAGQQLWIGAGSTTGRVVRAARRRGMPEHFVRMLASVRALTGRVAFGDGGLVLTMQLSPRAEEAP